MMPPEIRPAIRRLEITSQRLLSGLFDGDYSSRLRGAGMEFASIRPYEPGDDVRRIDWHATARTGATHVRLHRQERNRTLTLLADLSASCTPPKRDLLIQTVALIAFAACRHRDRVALVGFTDRLELLIPPGLGRRHIQRTLGELLTIRPAGRATDLEVPLRTALNFNRRPGMVLFLSDFHAPLPGELLRRTGYRHDLLAMILRDRSETVPLPSGPSLLRDAETGQERFFDLSPRRCRHLENTWTQTDRRLAGEFARLGIDHAFLQSNVPPIRPLSQLFRRRGSS